MKTGILGGSFNPVHSAHIALARAAAEGLSLDRVLFVPANKPPHKGPVELIDGRERAELIRRAISGERGFELSAIELDRGGVSYTVESLRELRRLYPGDKFYFLVGTDMLDYLPGWFELEEFLAKAVLAVAVRPGSGESVAAEIERVKIDIGKAGRLLRWESVEMEPIEASSTAIRKMLAEGKDPGNLLPRGVAEYIRERGLYSAK